MTGKTEKHPYFNLIFMFFLPFFQNKRNRIWYDTFAAGERRERRNERWKPIRLKTLNCSDGRAV